MTSTTRLGRSASLSRSLDQIEGIPSGCTHPLSYQEDLSDLNTALKDLCTLQFYEFDGDVVMQPAWSLVLDPLQEEARYLQWRYNSVDSIPTSSPLPTPDLHRRLHAWIGKVRDLYEKFELYSRLREDLRSHAHRRPLLGSWLLVQELSAACGLIPWRLLLELGELEASDKEIRIARIMTQYFQGVYAKEETFEPADQEAVSISDAAYGLALILQHAMKHRNRNLEAGAMVRYFTLWQECKAIHLAGLLHSLAYEISSFSLFVDDKRLGLFRQGRWLYLHGHPQTIHTFYHQGMLTTVRYSYYENEEVEGCKCMGKLPEVSPDAIGLPILWLVYRRLFVPLPHELSNLGILYLLDQGARMPVDLVPNSPWAEEIESLL